MGKKFREYKKLDLVEVSNRIGAYWRSSSVFSRSLSLRAGAKSFVFYEGPPSANGLPGIHHVMSRSLKDTICRYRTQKGYYVERKAGWDTHGLPVELGVEAMLKITKEDIGKSISVADYNSACRKEVMKYTDKWRELTEKMGFWINLDDPYVTYQTKYIETLWFLLKRLYEDGYLYKGKTIQPYSPAAGTGLSTHELNQPGCYRDVSDRTVVAQFRAIDAQGCPLEIEALPVFYLAWTTTPWTLPSNTALAVGEKIKYLYVKTFNPYTREPIVVILAEARFKAYFTEEGESLPFEAPTAGNAPLPWRIVKQAEGRELAKGKYQQLFPWVRPRGRSFEVLVADFVSTEDGTGIVHIAPTFGADDARVAKQNGIVGLEVATVEDAEAPMVDRRGRFTPLEDIAPEFLRDNVNDRVYGPWAGRFVKSVYTTADDPMGGDLDEDLCLDLRERGQAFRIEKQKHSYPHCWRTDKPVLYYPLDSWFIRTTAFKERLLELNETINWHPESTGSGRFGKWLENLVDWNLSRSRFWGTPLPIWATEDRKALICIGSLEELKNEIDKSVSAGIMKSNPLAKFKPGDHSEENYKRVDLHRPYVDEIVLVSPSGQPMRREPDLVDVWFDSGAMPYAQLHYPFENKDVFQNRFPADFIAEGVDQTRGWFFTLHTIATMLFDSVSFKNIISNGLVLDKKGNKMSKRLGNTVDPFETMDLHGADALRWYMLTNSQPWDNLKFDLAGVEEVVRKFFGTLYNTYSFFALYANIDKFTGVEPEILIAQRSESDRWIMSLLHSLIREVDDAFACYEPTRAGRAIQEFVIEQLSNWYVRLNRKRFWDGPMTDDKLSAYQTLYSCLEVVAKLIAPIAPFYADWLYRDLNAVSARGKEESVHCMDFPEADESLIDEALERRMRLAQNVSSLVLALRRKVLMKVRQPLQRIMIPAQSDEFERDLKSVESIILKEVNVKRVEYLDRFNTVIVKKIKPDFKQLGPRFGKQMKAITASLAALNAEEILQFEQSGKISLTIDAMPVDLKISEVEVLSEDIPGWLVATEHGVTVALDIMLDDRLIAEGAAREVINRVQNLRKDSSFNVTDRIRMQVLASGKTAEAILEFGEYIQQQTLCIDLQVVEKLPADWPSVEVDLEHNLEKIVVAIQQQTRL